MDVLSPQNLERDGFMGVPALTHNTRKTSVGEYVAKIRPAVAEQSRQKKKKQNGQ